MTGKRKNQKPIRPIRYNQNVATDSNGPSAPNQGLGQPSNLNTFGQQTPPSGIFRPPSHLPTFTPSFGRGDMNAQFTFGLNANNSSNPSPSSLGNHAQLNLPTPGIQPPVALNNSGSATPTFGGSFNPVQSVTSFGVPASSSNLGAPNEVLPSKMVSTLFNAPSRENSSLGEQVRTNSAFTGFGNNNINLTQAHQPGQAPKTTSIFGSSANPIGFGNSNNSTLKEDSQTAAQHKPLFSFGAQPQTTFENKAVPVTSKISESGFNGFAPVKSSSPSLAKPSSPAQFPSQTENLQTNSENTPALSKFSFGITSQSSTLNPFSKTVGTFKGFTNVPGVTESHLESIPKTNSSVPSEQPLHAAPISPPKPVFGQFKGPFSATSGPSVDFSIKPAVAGSNFGSNPEVDTKISSTLTASGPPIGQPSTGCFSSLVNSANPSSHALTGSSLKKRASSPLNPANEFRPNKLATLGDFTSHSKAIPKSTLGGSDLIQPKSSSLTPGAFSFKQVSSTAQDSTFSFKLGSSVPAIQSGIPTSTVPSDKQSLNNLKTSKSGDDSDADGKTDEKLFENVDLPFSNTKDSLTSESFKFTPTKLDKPDNHGLSKDMMKHFELISRIALNRAYARYLRDKAKKNEKVNYLESGKAYKRGLEAIEALMTDSRINQDEQNPSDQYDLPKKVQALHTKDAKDKPVPFSSKSVDLALPKDPVPKVQTFETFTAQHKQNVSENSTVDQTGLSIFSSAHPRAEASVESTGVTPPVFDSNFFANPSAPTQAVFGFNPTRALSAGTPNFSMTIPLQTSAGDVEEEVEGEGFTGERTNDALISTGQGEEDEVSLCEVRVKLMYFDSTSKEYKSLGVGPLKVNHNKTTGKYRILCRSEGSGNLLLNSSIPKLSVLQTTKPISVKFYATNAEGKVVNFTARIKEQTECDELYNLIKKAQE